MQVQKWMPPKRGERSVVAMITPYPSFVADFVDDEMVEEPAVPPPLEGMSQELHPDTPLGYLFHHPEKTTDLLRTLMHEQAEGRAATLWAKISPAQVGAQYLIALGQQTAGQVLGLLTRGEIDLVMEAIGTTPGLPHRRAEDIIDLAYRRVQGGEYQHMGAEILARALTEYAPVDDETRQHLVSREFDLQHLADMPPDQLAPLLIPEHPQIIAVVLSQLPPEASGRILDHLPESLRTEAGQRIATLEKVDPIALVDLERIATRVAYWEQTHDVGGIEIAAEILNRSGASTASSVLDAIEQKDPNLAAALRRLSLGQALERVRDFAMAMQTAEDLHKVLAALREELVRLGLHLTALHIHAIQPEQNSLEVIGASGREEAPLYIVDISDETLCHQYITQWRSSFAWFHELGDADRALWSEQNADNNALTWGADIPCNNGTLALAGPDDFSDSGIDLMEFSEVVDLAFARFSDFRTAAEAQQKLIAELEATNADLREAKDTAELANQAKSQFLANISHEIRTPMNAILGYAQILEHHASLEPDQRQAVQTIQQSGNHLLKLINEVLDLSKIEAGRMELHVTDFDLAHLLHSMSTMFELRCREKQLSWHLKGLETTTLPVCGDESKLMQVFINLLGNAVKFTGKGEVSLEVLHLDENRYRFVVSDTGQGISPQDQQRLFQAFEQGTAGVEKGGTGLGLAISQRILSLMDSQLELESTTGEGAHFSFEVYLPTAGHIDATNDLEQWERVDHLPAGVAVRALVVDDIEANRQILAQFLEVIGVEVEIATNGREAVEAVQRQQPNIVFMDIRMPVMDGMEAMRQIKKEASQLKVAAVSASTFEHERQEYLAAGFDAFIAKPVQTAELYSGLAQLLEIDFEFALQDEDDAPVETVDPKQVTLPAGLHAQLLSAAELAQVTTLEQHLDAMAELGADAATLARHLRQLCQDFQFDEVAVLLEQVELSD